MDERLEAIRRRKRVVLLLVFLAIIGALIFLFRAVLAPFLVAIFVAYLIDPLVERMSRLRLPKGLHLGRGGAIVIIYLVLIFLFYLGAMFTIPTVDKQVRQVREDLPGLRDRVEVAAQAVVDWYERVSGDDKKAATDEPAAGEPEEEKPAETKPPPEPPPPAPLRYRVRMKGGGELTGRLADQSDEEVVLRVGQRYLVLARAEIDRIEPIGGEDERFNLLKVLQKNIDQWTVHLDSALVFAIDFAKAVVKALYHIVLVLMITAFLCIDRPRIVAFLHSVPPDRHRETWQRLTVYLDRGLAGVIRGQLMICLVNGILTWIGLQLLGVRYSLLLGFVAGVLSLIPIFGTILSTMPILLIAWTFNGIEKGILSLVWILLIHFLEANFLNPKIMGSASKIHPVVVIFALIAGEYAYGIAGALLAVPAASLVQSCFRFFVLDRQLEKGDVDLEPEPRAVLTEH